MKRLLFSFFCFGFLFLQSNAQDTYSLQLKTSQGQKVDLAFDRKPVISFEKDSVVISTDDIKLMLGYGDAILSFVGTIPYSVNSERQDATCFYVKQGTVVGRNIPTFCIVRLYSIRGELLNECKPNESGMVHFSLGNIRDKFLIVNVNSIGLTFKLAVQ